MTPFVLVCQRHVDLWRRVAAAYRHGDLAHDAAHVQRVYRWALALAPEAGVSPDLAGAAALVHDRVHVPKHHRDRAEAADLSAAAARLDLAESGYAPDEVEAIVESVSGSNWSSGSRAASPLAMVLQDADRVDALGALGIARTFATAQAMTSEESAFYHPDDPLGHSDRTLDDRHFAVDHFRVKLLGLAAGMHFELSRREAAIRHQYMLGWLDELAREI